MSHPKNLFNKPPRTPTDLVLHLQTKGLTIPSVTAAEAAIERIGYYRLLTYTRSFQDGTKTFIGGTNFNHVLDAYEFDRELRLLCMGPIERIEITLRAAIVNKLAVAKGSHFYSERIHFHDEEGYKDFLLQVARLTKKDPSVAHYYAKYNDPSLPPIWVALEGLSFGTLSRMYSKLHLTNRKMISTVFGFHESVLVSWFRATNDLRNDCAHHNTLWDQILGSNPPAIARGLGGEFTTHHNRFSDRAVVLVALLNNIDPHYNWKADLKSLFAKYSTINPASLGFSANWDSRSFWI